jgi:hypothetical protein
VTSKPSSLHAVYALRQWRQHVELQRRRRPGLLAVQALLGAAHARSLKAAAWHALRQHAAAAHAAARRAEAHAAQRRAGCGFFVHSLCSVLSFKACSSTAKSFTWPCMQVAWLCLLHVGGLHSRHAGRCTSTGRVTLPTFLLSTACTVQSTGDMCQNEMRQGFP